MPQNPRYNLRDSSGNLLGTLYATANDEIAIHHAASDEEAVLGSGGISVSSVTSDSVETGAARINTTTPGIRLSGTETNAEDLTIRENAGSLELYDESAGAVAGLWDLNPELENESIAALDTSLSELRVDAAENRPTAGTANRVFIETDTGTIYRDNGTSWDVMGTTNIAETDHSAADHESGGVLEVTHNNLSLNSDDHHTRPVAGTLLSEDGSSNFNVTHTAADHEAGGSLEVTHNNLTLNSDDHHARPVAGTLLSEDGSNNFNVDIATDNPTASGDGTATTFTLTHSLGATPTVAHVQATSADAAGSFYVSNKTSTDIDVTYGTAPASGTDNLSFDIMTA